MTEMLEDLILTSKTQAMERIDILRHEYALAAAGGDSEDFYRKRDSLRQAIWDVMHLEQLIREKYKDV